MDKRTATNQTIMIQITILGLITMTILVLGAIMDRPSAFRTENIDIVDKIISITLHESLVTGTDMSCQAAAQTINLILEDNPGYKVYVLNDWVPSGENPITLEYSRKLIALENH